MISVGRIILCAAIIATVSCASPGGSDQPATNTVLTTPLVDQLMRGFVRVGNDIAAANSGSRIVIAGDGVIAISPQPRADLAGGPQPATLTLSPAELATDDATIAINPTPSVAEDGTVVQHGDGVIQRLRNSAAGVEQTWELARKPLGKHLRIRVPTAGKRCASTDTAGLHFTNGSDDLAFTYSHATWIDAAGKRTAIPARCAADGRGVIIDVDDDIVAESSFPAVLDPYIAPEYDTGPTVLASASAQVDADIATDGSTYVVVWSDSRIGVPAIFSTEISNTGKVNFAAGRRVSVSAVTNAQRHPRIARGSGSYLVVWDEQYYGQDTDLDIKGAILGSTGVAAAEPFYISLPSCIQQYPVVAWNGTNYTVAWESQGYSPSTYVCLGANSSRIRARRVSTSGAIVDASDIIVDAATAVQTKPALAAWGSGARIVYEYNNGTSHLMDRNMSTSGAVGSATDLGAGYNPTIACNSWHCIRAWEDGAGSVRARADSGTSYLVGTGVSPHISYVNIYNGGRIYYRSGSTLHGANISSWVSANLTPMTYSSGLALPRGAYNGTADIVVWGQDNDIRAAQVVNNFPTTSTLVTGEHGDAQYFGTVAPMPSGDYLVFWRDDHTGTPTIYGAVISPSGAVLQQPFWAAYGADMPQVTANLGYFLLTYYGTAGVSAKLFTWCGLHTVCSYTSPIVLSSYASVAPRVAAVVGGFRVVWLDSRSGTREVYGARISDGGYLYDVSGFKIADGPVIGSPDISCDPNFLTNGLSDCHVVYARQISNYWGDEVRVVRWQEGTATSGTAGVLLGSGSPAMEPRVSRSGSESLAVWAGLVGGVWGVRAARVAGTTVTPLSSAIQTGAGGGMSGFWQPDVVFDGTDYVVSWDDGTVNSSGYVCSTTTRYARAVSTAGALLGSGPTAVVSGISDYFYGAGDHVRGPGRELMFVYTRRTCLADVPARLYFRTVTFP